MISNEYAYCYDNPERLTPEDENRLEWVITNGIGGYGGGHITGMKNRTHR